MNKQLIFVSLAMSVSTAFWACSGGPDLLFTPDGSCNDLLEIDPGGVPRLEVSRSRIDFQYPFVATTSFPRSVTMTNTGANTMTIERVLTNCEQFVLIDPAPLPAILQPAAETSFSISFEPQAAVEADPEAPPSVTGQLLVYFEGIAEPLVVMLTGTGVAEEHIVNQDPLAVDFGTVQVGETRPRVAILIWNGGTGTETISSVSTVPPFRVFGFSGETELQPATAFEIEVQFAPDTVGDFQQVVIIELNVPGFQVFVGLQLRGIAN